MRAELARARRRSAVRAAARDWQNAGRLPEGALSAIETLYPDDRVSKPPIWRILVFAFSCVILSTLFAIIGVGVNFSRDTVTPLCLIYGLTLVAATEYQLGALRFDGVGSESATSYLSLSFLIMGSVNLFDGMHSPRTRAAAILFLAAALIGAGWWRWGYPIYAGAAAVALYFAVSAISPAPRLAWLGLSLVAGVAAARFQDSASLAPGQRSGLPAVLAVSLCAAYASLNLFSLDKSLIEQARPSGVALMVAFPGVRAVSIAATALFPAAVFAYGFRRRRRLLIDAGLVFAALSLVTLGFYVKLGPLWLVLLEAGAAMALIAAGLGRLLDRGPGRERAGFTADPLFENDESSRLLTAAAVLTTASPVARAVDAGGSFTGAGGGFGGGGASGDL